MKRFVMLAATAALFFSSNSFSAEAPHPILLGDVTGNGIALKMHDHAIAGGIKDFVIWGFVDEETFSSEMIMRKDKQIIKATFGKQENGKIGGVIRHTLDGKERTTALQLQKVNGAAKQIIISINDVEVTATVSSEDFQNGHHINPTVTFDFDGQTISYRMQGEGCYGYLAHTLMMIAGAYLH